LFPLVWLVISKDFVPSFFGVELQRLFSIYFKITKKKKRNWSYFGNFGIVEICLKVLNCSTHSFELFTFFSKQIKRNSRIQISCIFSIFFLFFIKKIKKQAQTILINSQHNFYISFWWLTIRKKRQIIDLEVFLQYWHRHSSFFQTAISIVNINGSSFLSFNLLIYVN